MTYSEFVNKELVQFSNADNERSIPSIVDGELIFEICSLPVERHTHNGMHAHKWEMPET